MTRVHKVAFIIDSLRFGGAEKHTVELFNSLDPARFQKGLVYLKREEQLVDLVDSKQGDLWCAEFGQGWDYQGALRLGRWFREFGPDVVVCVNQYPLFYAHVTRFFGRGKFEIFEVFHSTVLPPNEYRKMRWIYRALFNSSDRIVFVGAAQQRYWERRGVRSERATRIHNGVDCEFFRDTYSPTDKVATRIRYGFGPDDFLVGICAALRKEKHHADLLNAVARLNNEGTVTKCLIIGDGPMRNEVEADIAKLNLSGDVAITGFQADVRPLLAACDCMALVSHEETFSIAALEAMAMSKAMVMSATGGADEQVREGQNGYLFPVGDVDALLRALRKMADPAQRTVLGLNARALVEGRFSLHVMLARYSALLASEATTR